MHSHDNLCELLLVYRGLGSYIIRNRSFPIQEGDVLFYNQDKSHGVCSASHEEISTYCFAFVGLQFQDLPPNHIIPFNSQPVLASGIRFKFFRQLCEEAYQNMGTGPNGDAFAQCLSTAFLLSARDLAESSFKEHCSENDLKLADRIRRYM